MISATFFYEQSARISHRTVSRCTKTGKWGDTSSSRDRPCNKQVREQKTCKEHSLLWRMALQQKREIKISSNFTILSFTHLCLPISMNFYWKSLSPSKTIEFIKKNLNCQQLIDYSTPVLFLVHINAKHLICSDEFLIIKHLISSRFSILHSDLE